MTTFKELRIIMESKRILKTSRIEEERGTGESVTTSKEMRNFKEIFLKISISEG